MKPLCSQRVQNVMWSHSMITLTEVFLIRLRKDQLINLVSYCYSISKNPLISSIQQQIRQSQQDIKANPLKMQGLQPMTSEYQSPSTSEPMYYDTTHKTYDFDREYFDPQQFQCTKMRILNGTQPQTTLFPSIYITNPRALKKIRFNNELSSHLQKTIISHKTTVHTQNPIFDNKSHPKQRQLTTRTTMCTLNSRCIETDNKNDEQLFTDPSLLAMIRMNFKQYTEERVMTTDENNPNSINRQQL